MTINRRDFLRSIGIGTAAMAWGGRTKTEAPRTRNGPGVKPNIVLFIADDLGYGFVGCNGDSSVKTPNLDALARRGMNFSSAFAASPTCSPSRAALLTGLYPQRNGTMGNHTDCRPDVKALPAHLRALGYRVVAANKTDVRPPSVFDWESLPAELPKNPKLDRRYRGEGLDTARVDAFLADHAKNRGGQPLCLLIGDNCPHVVWQKNEIYDPAALRIPPNMVDTPITRRALANYYQEITVLDRHVGDVLESLRRHGFDDRNTLFVFTSDQGPEWPHCKWTCYDTGLRVPLIVRWPGAIKPDSHCRALVSLVDVMPTLIEVAGGPAPGGIDGIGMMELLTGRTDRIREETYASHTGDGTMNMFPQRSVRNERYQYILNLHPEREWTTHFTKVGGIPESHKEIWDTWIEKAKVDASAAKLVDLIRHHPAEELYDTTDDPFELHNLADDPRMKPVLENLRGKLARWRERVGDEDTG
jgi:N-sulfoglucosamine sulfohydrolase